jgi:hypothetical protein
MIGLCLGLAGMVWVQIPASDFTLAWDHTVERIRWEEDYQVTADGLLLGQARIKGSGAGMEAPAGARFHDGSWHYQGRLPPLQPLRLGRTPEAGDYELCLSENCHPLSHWLGPPSSEQAAVELWSCALDNF